MALLVAAVQIAIVAYAPGAVLFRLPWGDRARRSALPAEERAFWCILLSLAVSMAAVLALAAGGAYTLGRLLAVDVGVVLGALVGSRGRIRFEHAPRPTAAAVLPLVIVAAGAWLYFPTAEYVMGGKDPGVYLSEGVQIAQRGTLSIDDRVVASVPSSFRDLFFAKMDGRPYYGMRFMGFFLFDPSTGEVVGQFPHLLPASVAVAYGIAGLDGARATVALWAILGLVAVYFVAARIIGRAGALLAAGLLTIHVIEVWYGRYPNTEVALQALVMAALLAADRALVERNRFFEIVTGLLLGLLLFLRFDSVLAAGGVFLAVALASVRGRRPSWRFFVAFGLSGALGAWYLLEVLIGYTVYPLGFLQNLPPSGKVLLVASMLVALAVLIMGHRLGEQVRRASEFAPLLMTVVLVALAVYAYFFRHPGGTLAPHDAYAFRTYAWYVTPAGLLAAVIGTGLLFPRLFWTSPAFFSTAATFSVFFFYKTKVVPEHFWMTRRFLPVILPATLIMIAGLVVACANPGGPVAQWLQRRFPEPGGARVRRLGQRIQRLVAGVAIVLVTVLAVVFWRAAMPIRDHVEYRGMIGHLSRILEQSGPEDLLLFEARGASDMHVLALPLAYIYGRDVLVLASRSVDTELLSGFVEWALGRYRNVYFLGRGQPLLSRHLDVLQVWSDVFWVPEYESLSNAYPTRVKLKEFRYQQCRLLPAAQARTPVVPLDDVHLVNFHDLERDQHGAWRWSRAASDALLTNVAPDTSAVSISMENGGRPASAPPALVEVTLAGRLLGRVVVGESTRPYVFAVPRDLALELSASGAPAVLRLAVRTWSPKQVLGSADGRDLGVMVSRIEVSRSPLDPQPGVSSPERNN